MAALKSNARSLEEVKRAKDKADDEKRRAERRARRAAGGDAPSQGPTLTEIPDTNVAFLFPGQGSQVSSALYRYRVGLRISF